MLDTSVGMALTLYVGMPLDLWLAMWSVLLGNSPERRAAFLALYHLEIATIEDVEAPYEAVRPVDGFYDWWLEVALWALTPASVCPDGCGQSQRPVM